MSLELSARTVRVGVLTIWNSLLLMIPSKRLFTNASFGGIVMCVARGDYTLNS